jgi:hypothetical protein
VIVVSACPYDLGPDDRAPGPLAIELL